MVSMSTSPDRIAYPNTHTLSPPAKNSRLKRLSFFVSNGTPSTWLTTSPIGPVCRTVPRLGSWQKKLGFHRLFFVGRDTFAEGMS